MELRLLDRAELKKTIPQLVELFKSSLSENLHGDYCEAYFKWRQLENPYNDVLTCVALDKGKIVSSSSGSPCHIFINNKLEKAAITMNAATCPEYRGQGLYTTVVKMLTGHLQKKGYKMLYTFPNYISHRATVTRLGRKDVYEIPTMELKLEKIKHNFRIKIETDHHFELDYDDYHRPFGLNCVQKSKAYLRWRYGKNPLNTYFNFVLHHKGKVKSFMVVKQYQRKLNIIDFQPSNPEDAEYLLQAAVNFARSLSLEEVTTWAPLHTYYHTLCEKDGFRNNAPITYFCLQNLTKGEIAISTRYSDWYIQLGDFNAY